MMGIGTLWSCNVFRDPWDRCGMIDSHEASDVRVVGLVWSPITKSKCIAIMQSRYRRDWIRHDVIRWMDRYMHTSRMIGSIHHNLCITDYDQHYNVVSANASITKKIRIDPKKDTMFLLHTHAMHTCIKFESPLCKDTHSILLLLVWRGHSLYPV